MKLEHEHRYLLGVKLNIEQWLRVVEKAGIALNRLYISDIYQYYVNINGRHYRVREQTELHHGSGKHVIYYLTEKGPRDLSGTAFEDERALDPNEYYDNWQQYRRSGLYIKKFRIEWKDSGRVYCIDHLPDHGLTFLEVELPGPVPPNNTAPFVPVFMQDALLLDVTSSNQFTNYALAIMAQNVKNTVYGSD